MTEAQWEHVHLLYESLSEDIHELVNTRTELLEPEVDDALRQKLTEDFRFWRRPQ